MSTRTVGEQGERMAEAYLKGLGGQLLARNYAAVGGEVDLIFRLDGFVVFVEVKRRNGLRYGAPAEAVTPAKQRRICRAALCYLARNGLMEAAARFDVVEVLGDRIRHIPNAFEYQET